MGKTKFHTVRGLNIGVEKNEDYSASRKQLSYFSKEDLKAMGSLKKPFAVIPIDIKLVPVGECDLPPVVMDNQMTLSLHLSSTEKRV